MASNTGKTSKTPARPRRRKAAATAEVQSKGNGKGKALAIGAALGAIVAGAFAVLKLGKNVRGSAEHVPTDLMGDTHPGPDDRAPVDFRPDPTASIPAGERDAFRPALAGASAPTLVSGQARENARLDAAPS